jgi:hypothetical protein
MREVHVGFVDIGGIVDHHCLIFPCFVDIGGIVDHHCLIFLCFVDIGGIIDHHLTLFKLSFHNIRMLKQETIFYYFFQNNS